MKSAKSSSKTNGGNGGWSRRSKVDAGFSKPLKTNTLGAVVAPNKNTKKK
jgi:hypothetical protein